MHPTHVAYKLRDQLTKFLGIFSPHFSKPKARFIAQMIYGLQAGGDVKLSTISRSLGESISLKKTEERLSRHLDTAGLGQRVNELISAQGVQRVRRDSLIVIDPTDIRKNYARKMPYLAQVRDGSTGELVPGYWGCVAIACDVGKRKVIPLHQRLWSAQAPDFESENAQLLQIVDTIRPHTGERGIYVMDRGGDRIRLFDPLLDRKLRFIIRQTGARDLRFRRSLHSADSLAQNCPMAYTETILKEEKNAEQRRLTLQFGFRPVKLPGREEQLYLVVVRGLGQEPVMLLTNLPLLPSRKSLWFVVEGYLSRWLVEESIRFIKQSYRLEDIRVLSYERLRNLTALVLAAAYFAAVWLGQSVRLSVLTCRVTRTARRFFGVPQFHYYALADGIAFLLRRLTRWERPAEPRAPPDLQLSFPNL